MNQSNKDTDDILDAIKSMMSNDQLNSEQRLPKDIIELTEPIDEKIHESEPSILELTELVVDNVTDKKSTLEAKEMQISEDQIRNVVRSTIESLPRKTIDNIINEELKRVILDRLSSAKISISPQDNKE
jgi:hypothetical protein